LNGYYFFYPAVIGDSFPKPLNEMIAKLWLN